MTMSTAELDTVTRPNTVKHWVLYTLDAIEAEHAPEATPHDADEDGGINTARDRGVTAKRIYEFAAGDDSIVFSNQTEISAALSDMGTMAQYYDNESRPVNRKAIGGDWYGPDCVYGYRLTGFGRSEILKLGVPDKLPNRHDFDDEDRVLGVKPAHEPGWWRDDWDHFSSEWSIYDNEWVATDHDRVFYFRDAEEWGRGELPMVYEIADAFPNCTFVITMGPHRFHDISYCIRDPFNWVIQIDIYSPGLILPDGREWDEHVSALVTELHHALESVHEDL